MRSPLSLLVGVTLAAAPLAAQDFNGTYTTRNDQGNPVTLSLSQDAQGKVTGTLSGNGNTFQVAGVLEGTSAVGAVTNPQMGGMYFQADLEGNELVLILVGVGANNEPDHSQTQEIRFTRAAGGVAQGAGATEPRAGLGGLLGGGAGGPAAGDPWVGTWSGGGLTLTLQGGGGQYQGTAAIQGQQYPVTGQGGGNQLSGTYSYNGQSFPWQAQLQGGTMVLSVDGQTVQLQQGGAQGGQGGQPAQMGPMAPAGGAATNVGQLSPQGREWYQWLVGKRLTQMDSYYSGPAYDGAVGGGYSSQKVVDLCTDGRFFYSGSGHVSVSGDGVSGYNRGGDVQTGQWRIIEQGGLVGIEFRWQDGSATQHRLDYQDNKTHIDGTRTFVTEDNQSCR